MKKNDNSQNVESQLEVNLDSWNTTPSKIVNLQDISLHGKIETKISGIIQEIENLVNKSRFFRNKKASTATIAAKLGIPTSHIVFVFKYYSKTGFVEYKAINKVRDAIQLIDQGYLNNNTLESLAYKIGFSSYNPFFTAFKRTIGMSPNDYVSRR